MTANIRVLVLGCGSIGRRHLNNMKALGIREFILCDPSAEALERASARLSNPVLTNDLSGALKAKPGAAVVCTPSSMHLENAIELAIRGVHLLIEKPLSHELAGCDELQMAAGENGIVAMMAMCYRFHPVLLRVKELIASKAIGRVFHANYFGGHYLPDWHPHADYRREYAANRSLGGGVVLTSIHGLDNIRWLFGEVEELSAFVDKVSALEMDVEDIALGLFKTKNGVYVNWQTDFLQRANQHRLVVAGTDGTIRCDVIEGTIEIFRAGKGGWSSEKVLFETNTMYMNEMSHFLECIERKERPSIDLKDGIRTLKLALEVKEKGSLREVKECLTA